VKTKLQVESDDKL